MLWNVSYGLKVAKHIVSCVQLMSVVLSFVSWLTVNGERHLSNLWALHPQVQKHQLCRIN